MPNEWQPDALWDRVAPASDREPWTGDLPEPPLGPSMTFSPWAAWTVTQIGKTVSVTRMRTITLRGTP